MRDVPDQDPHPIALEHADRVDEQRDQEHEVRAGNRQGQREPQRQEHDADADQARPDQQLPAPAGRPGEPPRAACKQSRDAIEHRDRERASTRALRQPGLETADHHLHADQRDREPERGRQAEERDRDQREDADQKAEATLGRLVDELADGQVLGAWDLRRLALALGTQLAQELVEPQPSRCLGGDGFSRTFDIHGETLALRARCSVPGGW